MAGEDYKAVLHRYLNISREVVVWKLDGLSEYDIRRPLVPTGTNLLGLIKHLASIEAGYFGDVFGRPLPDPPAYFDYESVEPNTDMWATADESRDDILGLYQRVRAHADETIESLPLDAPGRVPWWGDAADVTLFRMLVHVATETDRHAGQADIVRELIDGAAGLVPTYDNLASNDPDWWAGYVARVEAAAATFKTADR